ncbi:MAG: bifunctional 4-hydroxy-2-oxoglutarate aldolase/2-dehydro-3-deoxy-phosphogluconate aldolase [Bacteroidales bacterium]
MARFPRLTVYQKMMEEGIIPVFYNPDPEICRQVIQCCNKAGLHFFEFTNRGDYAHELFAELNKWAAREYPDLIMGTGSVMDASTASLYMQLGSNFIVSPLLDEGTAIACNRRKVAWIPGTGSVTEISRAEELGAEIIKIFPGGAVGGPKFVAAVKGPMPWVSLMPTSGVDATEESIKSWFGAGVACVGLGSQLFTKEILQEKNWTRLTKDIHDALQLIRKYKSQ